MVDLRTTYMGIPIKNPIVVGASPLSEQINRIKKIEAAGAGALVLRSLFEEQIQLEQGALEDELSQYEELYAEAMTLFPKAMGGPREHLYWVSEAKKAVSMPLIASINVVHSDLWVDYAIKLARTGVDGLELNFYSPPLDPSLTSCEIEQRELELFMQIRDAVEIPLAVKIHPHYTSLMNVAASFDQAGADALVLFNRIFQPDISIVREREQDSIMLSSSADNLISLRWTALLFRRIDADIISSTGIMNGRDVIKMLLVGANAVQIVSTLFQNKLVYIEEMLLEVATWMEGKGYTALDEMRGRVSKRALEDPWAFERGQYIKALFEFDCQ